LNDERKLDVPLSAAYGTWREHSDLAPDASIAVSLMFTGELAPIEALGFETHGVFGDQALGLVYFKDIPALVGYDGVLWLAAGRVSRRDLDTAVHDIRARASAPISGPAVDGVWHADVATGAFTHIPHATGKGVIVAIMDTGIDYTHPMFISGTSPTVKTRILRIWDQGLTPAAVTNCPPSRLLVSSDTYGVEFTSAQIEADLNGAAGIAHRDCIGHGTHVAGIAAGGTHFPSVVGDASKVGVAPEADIIAVKILDNPDKIFYTLANGSTGGEVPWTRRFADGVLYCLRTARELDNRPVVINMSFGDDSYPGDGLDEDARFVDAVLDPTHAAGDNNFPTGAIIVKSAGNEGSGDMQVGRVEVPASGEIIVPFTLVDVREGAQTDWRHCRQERYKPDFNVYFWYRRPTAPLSVSFAVRFPFGPGPFSADVQAGGKLELGINPVVGPPANDVAVAFATDIHRITIEHKDMPAVPHPAGGTVQRQFVQMSIGAKDSGGVISYHQGIYEVRIKAPAGTVIFLKGELRFWNMSPAVLRLNDKNRDGTARHANITVLRESSIFDPLGQNVLTVAAYTELADVFSGVPDHGISDFSSRGPLRDYSDPPRAPYCVKPDIAAPGQDISSAHSRHTEGFLRWPWWYWGVRFQDMSGTSMASPMIAGLVALMLEKNPHLNATQVRTALSSAPRTAVEPGTAPGSTNAYGVGMVDALTSHANTP
jgi:subtilisin family serine protease